MSFWSRVTEAFTDFFFGGDDEPEYREESREERELEAEIQDREIPDYSDRQSYGYEEVYLDNLERAEEFTPDDLTETQYETVLELIDEMLDDGYEWDDILDMMYEDFWEWYAEFYGEN